MIYLLRGCLSILENLNKEYPQTYHSRKKVSRSKEISECRCWLLCLLWKLSSSITSGANVKSSAWTHLQAIKNQTKPAFLLKISSHQAPADNKYTRLGAVALCWKHCFSMWNSKAASIRGSTPRVRVFRALGRTPLSVGDMWRRRGAPRALPCAPDRRPHVFCRLSVHQPPKIASRSCYTWLDIFCQLKLFHGRLKCDTEISHWRGICGCVALSTEPPT